MDRRRRQASYIAMWIFAITFGWIEAATVVYLRATSPAVANSAIGTQFPAVLISNRLIAVEIVREACTILVLGVVAWLASRRWTDRLGAFLLTFGVWDLTYYVVLRLISGWPDALTNRDILFLIPVPWIAPVWAPAIVAAIFAAAGSHLYWTAQRPRPYTVSDSLVLLAAAGGVVTSFLVDWRGVLVSQPRDFRQWLFWIALTGGAAWFVQVERRQRLR
jgi:hypothetical protein